MFNRYWREYPFFLQLVLLMLMLITMTSAAYIVGFLLTPVITDVSVVDMLSVTESSNSKVLNSSRLMQILNNLTNFAAAAFLYAYASHPAPRKYLGLRKVQRPVVAVLAVLLALAALPFILQLGQWMKDIFPGLATDGMQKRSEEALKAYMTMKSPAEFIFTLFVFAAVPAFGEELFFRGVVMRLVHKRTKNAPLAIFMSAGIFALIHFQVLNLLPIFAMGMLLGYAYYYSGSLWVSMLVHFVFNGLQICLSYMAELGVLPKRIAEMESFPVYVVIVSLAVAVALFYLFRRMATPLQQSWSSDFTDEEQAQRQQEKTNIF